jgi:hypothetical protein
VRALTVWIVGTTYVLAALVGAAVLVWAADHEDNSADPTHWAIGAAVVLAPVVLAGVPAASRTWGLRRVAERRPALVIGTAVAVAVTAALIVGARAIIIDANACGDDDCVTLSIPLAVTCVLVAWSLPLGLSVLRRWRYPAPLTSVGMVAASTTLVAGVAAAVQRTRQEDNYADLELGIVLSAWVLPALVVVVLLLRGPVGTVAHRTGAGRARAGFVAAVGSWLIALPFAAGVDSDSVPILLAVAGAPGVVVSALGLIELTSRTVGMDPRADERSG